MGSPEISDLYRKRSAPSPAARGVRLAVGELLSMARPLEERDLLRLESLAREDTERGHISDRRDLTRLLTRANHRLSPALRTRLEKLIHG